MSELARVVEVLSDGPSQSTDSQQDAADFRDDTPAVASVETSEPEAETSDSSYDQIERFVAAQSAPAKSQQEEAEHDTPVVSPAPTVHTVADAIQALGQHRRPLELGSGQSSDERSGDTKTEVEPAVSDDEDLDQTLVISEETVADLEAEYHAKNANDAGSDQPQAVENPTAEPEEDNNSVADDIAAINKILGGSPSSAKDYWSKVKSKI